MNPRCCHYCGRPLPENRLGVRLRPVEGQIFDIIQNAGARGITNNALYELTLLPRNGDRHTLNTHIFNINERIEEAGYQIVGRHVRKLVKQDQRVDRDALTPKQQKAFGL